MPPSSPTLPAGRQVLLAGATGLVGRELLHRLLADPGVARVHALVRRPWSGAAHPKLQARVVDLGAPPALPPLHEAYLALGTTIKVAGSQAAFRAVDFDAALAVARAAHAAGAQRMGLVSAMGADPRSRVFYNRVKGELEEALAALGLQGLVVARPSLLLGDRTALGQPERAGEKIGMRAGAVLGRLLPGNLRPIAAADVAAALAARVPMAQGRTVLLSGAMQEAAVAAVAPVNRATPD